MFSLPDLTTCRLLHVSPREEKHGDLDVLAVDLKLSMTIANERLRMFDEGLLSALYLDPNGAQDGLDGIPLISTELRCRILEPVSLELVVEGRDVQIRRATSVLVLPACKIAKFKIEAKEGGSCEVVFRVQCSKVAPETVGELCGMLNRQIDVLIVESVAADDDVTSAAAENDGPESTAELDATQAFLATMSPAAKPIDGSDAE